MSDATDAERGYLSDEDARRFAARLEKLHENLAKVILGKDDVLELVEIALIVPEGLSPRHVLIEDLPGLGKTVLARAVAKSIHASSGRFQCTPDMLPSAFTGFGLFRRDTQEYEFQKTALYNDIVLVDEGNRATPKAQAALLEAMAEGAVTVEGERRQLPTFFWVIFTQNPIEFEGTYPLPEAQRDRFLFLLELGYPDFSAEVKMAEDRERENPLDALEAVTSVEEMLKMREATKRAYLHPSLREWIAQLVQATRQLTTTGVIVCDASVPAETLTLTDIADHIGLLPAPHVDEDGDAPRTIRRWRRRFAAFVERHVMLRRTRRTIAVVVWPARFLAMRVLGRAAWWIARRLWRMVCGVMFWRHAEEVRLEDRRVQILEVGASPRATLALQDATRARALRRGRSFVLPEDIEALFLPVIRHRIIAGHEFVNRARSLGDDVALGELKGACFAIAPRPRGPSWRPEP